jgi:hypothetical protein
MAEKAIISCVLVNKLLVCVVFQLTSVVVVVLFCVIDSIKDALKIYMLPKQND